MDVTGYHECLNGTFLLPGWGIICQNLDCSLPNYIIILALDNWFILTGIEQHISILILTEDMVSLILIEYSQ